MKWSGRLWMGLIVMVVLVGCGGDFTTETQSFGEVAAAYTQVAMQLAGKSFTTEIQSYLTLTPPQPSPNAGGYRPAEHLEREQILQLTADEAAARQALALAELERARLEQTQEAGKATQQAAEITRWAQETEVRSTEEAIGRATEQAVAWLERTAAAGDAQATATRSAQETVSEALAVVDLERARAAQTQAAETAVTYSTSAAAAMRHSLALQGIQETQAVLAVVRAERVNEVLAWWELFAYPVLFALIVCLAMWVYWFWKRNQVVALDGRGQAPVIITSGKVTWPERMLRETVDPHNPWLEPLEAQVRVVDNAQKVQGLRQVDPRRREVAKVMAPSPTLTPGPSPEGEGSIIPMPMKAAWEVFEAYNGEGIAMGVDERGQLMVQVLEVNPHRLIAGKTGGGKSRYGVRVSVTAALARGMVVVSLGETAPVDLKVFEGQANFYRVQLDDPREVLGYLEGLKVEISRRLDVLWQEGASTWGHLTPRLENSPRALVVMDEYAALSDALEGERARFHRLTGYLSRLARKAGVHLLVGVQNPTRENIPPNIRRNMLLQAFAMVDAQASRAVLERDGAEKLAGAQYLAIYEELRRGVAFDPTDEQIRGYLERRRVIKVETPGWITPMNPRIAPIDQATQINAGIELPMPRVHPLGPLGAGETPPSARILASPPQSQAPGEGSVMGYAPLRTRWTSQGIGPVGQAGGHIGQGGHVGPPLQEVALAEKIRGVWEAGGSKRAMARAAGGEYAGAMAGKVDRAVEWLEGATTTTATERDKLGVERGEDEEE